MELMIDGKSCQTESTCGKVPGVEGASWADIDASRQGRTMTLFLPRTPINDEVVGFAGDPHAQSLFNGSLHRAEVTADGSVMMAGVVRLTAVTEQGYTLEIRSGGSAWASQAARRLLSALSINFSASLTPAAICESWTNAAPVKFFPIDRDSYEQQNASTDLLPAERLLSVDDYHPFLHIATLVEKIFSEAGYRIDSRFFETPFFRSLYMSGAYSSTDTAAAVARMGFLARRLNAVTATADYMGRVYANPKVAYNTVGNLVETATAGSIDQDGEAVSGLYNNGNCFTLNNGKICYTPLSEVSVGFEYYLRYTTDHRILSRTRLTGFDTIYFGSGVTATFTLANRYVDRRPALTNNYTYRAVVFDHVSGAQYRLLYSLNGASGTLWTTFSDRTAAVTTPASGLLASPVLQVKNGTTWVDYAGDWALYDGYITETGQTTVELRLHTPAERISPASPKFFNLIYFEGADEGMKLTLHKECSLRPRFQAGPGIGDRITFADVAQLHIRQHLLIEALAHLFNLRFLTDEAAKTVYIEPYDDFFSGAEVDWRAKTDFSQSITRRPLALDVHETRTWGYLAGDGAVARFDSENDTVLGDWTVTTDSYAALEGEKEQRSPLFRPSRSSTGHYLNAPSARLLQVGDRDSAEEDGTNFSPRIVCYAGLHPLEGDERWGYPANASTYPLAAFHFAGDVSTTAFSLCFEDRDGVTGLHRFYDRQVRQEALRERITLSLQLSPAEFSTLFLAGTGLPELRSRYLLDTGEGTVKATLYRIESYDPEAASVRCTFTRLTEY